jgi:transposase
MRPIGSFKQLQKRRQIALEMIQQGKSSKEVANKLGVNERSVRRWCQEQKQPRKQKARSPGKPAYLSEKQIQRLEQELLCGAYAHGYSEDYWTLDRIGHVIWDLFQVRYTASGVWRLLDRMDWSCQKVQRLALQRNDEAITNWNRHVWPRIKKVASIEGHAPVNR